MKLSNIKLAGFKSISREHPLEMDLGNVNVLIGANGVGKSNIIGFFKLLGYMMSGSMQRFIEENGTSQVFFHYGSKETDHISGELLFTGKKLYDKYNFQLSYASPGSMIFTSEVIEWGRKNIDSPSYKEALPLQYKESALSDPKDETSRQIHSALSFCKVYQFHDTSMRGYLRQSSPIGAARYLQSKGNNLASFLYLLKDEYKESYLRIKEYIREVMPLFGDFYLEPNRQGYVFLNWKDSSGSDYILRSDQLSDGSLRLIALATLLLQPRETMPPIIIIDEPELGLHPTAISVLARMIKDASMKAQIIVATQSPNLVSEFEADDIIVVENANDKRSSTTCSRLDAQSLKHWLEHYTLGELWEKNIIGGRP